MEKYKTVGWGVTMVLFYWKYSFYFYFFFRDRGRGETRC